MTAEEIQSKWREKHFSRTWLGDHGMQVTLELAEAALAEGRRQGANGQREEFLKILKRNPCCRECVVEEFYNQEEGTKNDE